MYAVQLAVLIVILLGVVTVLKRAVSGPTLMDRILTVNMIGTKTIVLLALIGFMQVELGVQAGAEPGDFSRAGFFLDIALAYALINFIATIAVLKVIEQRAQRRARQGAGDEA